MPKLNSANEKTENTSTKRKLSETVDQKTTEISENDAEKTNAIEQIQENSNFEISIAGKPNEALNNDPVNDDVNDYIDVETEDPDLADPLGLLQTMTKIRPDNLDSIKKPAKNIAKKRYCPNENCTFSYKQDRYLRYHLRVECGKTFRCEYCSGVYTLIHSYRNHIGNNFVLKNKFGIPFIHTFPRPGSLDGRVGVNSKNSKFSWGFC